jgi:cell division protein FtsQ
LLALIVGGVAGVEIYQYRAARMWGSELFLLEEIVVEGNDRIPSDEIAQVLGLTINATTMQQVVPRNLESRVRAAFVDFKDVEVVREMPGRVRVRVVERQPLARVRVDGETLVIDEEGVALERPFKLAVPPATKNEPKSGGTALSATTEAQKQDIARRVAALPLIDAQVSRGDLANAVVAGDGLVSALKLLAFNREQSIARARPASLANLVRPTPPTDPTTPPAPKPKTPRRVLRVAELEDRPLEVESIDAKDPRKIIVRFRPHHRRGVTAWFSEGYLADGLSNFYRAYTYRLLTVPMEYDAPLVASASAATALSRANALSLTPSSPMIENRESSREHTQPGIRPGVASQESSSQTSAVVSSTTGISSLFTQERYDARFESTLYITSTGGQNG